MKVGERVSRLLRSPRVVVYAVGVAVLLNLPSLGNGWQMDDLTHRAQFLEVGPMTDSTDMTNRMFDFLRGDPEKIKAWKDIGVLPWWGNDRLKFAFWRPVSALTHVIDYALWPDSGPLMHAQNLVWMGALVALVGLLYRRLLSVSIAGLAVLLYALDDAHGIPAGWLANRNAVVAAVFGFLSLIAHHRWRQDGWRPGGLLGPLAFLVALLGGESGTGIAAYLFAHTVFLDGERAASRFKVLLPYVGVGGAWLLYYKAAGYGTSGSGFYLDPLSESSAFLSAMVVRAPVLLLGQWFLPPSSFAFMWTPDQMVIVACVGVGVLTLIGWLLWPILKSRVEARFFAIGMLIAVVPTCATIPHDRLLLYVGFGAMGLLSLLIHALADDIVRWRRVLGWVFVVVHVVIAAPFQTIFAMSPKTIEPAIIGPGLSLPDDPALIDQRLVIVNAPSFFYAQPTMLVRRFADRLSPRSLLMLAPGVTEVTVHRLSENEMTVDVEDGYLLSPLDILFRCLDDPIEDDYRIALTGVEVALMEKTSDGRPQSAAFTFDVNVEDESLRWVRYEEEVFIPFELPAVGETVTLEAVAIPF